MQSYREQAIQLLGTVRGVVVPGNGINTDKF